MKSSTRESSFELLKVVAIVLIVISHVTQTLSDHFIDLTSLHSAQFTVLSVFMYIGYFGNLVFFICSAWFFMDSNRVSGKKWFFILVEIWFISILMLVVSYIYLHGEIRAMDIIKSFFPTIFGNNWYMTCYLLFYPIHPFLNTVIAQLDQKTHFRVILSAFLLYYGISFVYPALLFSSVLIIWVIAYFAVAYVRKYDISTKGNVALFVIGLAGFVGLPVLSGILGQHISFFSGTMLRWAGNNNPFLFFTALSLFNFARKIHFRNSIINSISQLSLLIYIIHENLIFRTYIRTDMVLSIYEKYGESTVVLQVLVLSAFLMAVSLACAFLYKITIRNYVSKVSSALCHILKTQYLRLEKCLLTASRES